MTRYTADSLPLSTDELAGIRCALRSGQELTLEEARALLATVDALQVALTRREGRVKYVAEVGS